MTKTQKNHMKKWIEALRSGEYRKTTGKLSKKGKKSQKFCAMGVACDLYMQANKKAGWEWDSDCFAGPGGDYLIEAPPCVEYWLGIKDQEPVIMRNDGNDDCYDPETEKSVSIKPHSFNKIADYLENKYFPKK
jgi:hypothetical protein